MPASRLCFGALAILSCASCISAFYVTASGVEPQSSSLAVKWFAPFYAGGGYCSEAFAIASALHHAPSRNFSVEIVHHGDSINEVFLAGLTPKEQKFMHELDSNFNTDALARRGKSRKQRNKPIEVVVCHSEPGAWHAPYPNYHTTRCPPASADYKIGRSMFETDRLPSGWSSRLMTMDEIWVPTSFARDIFIKGGVEESRVHVIGEPVDTSFYAPQDLTDLEAILFSEVELDQSGLGLPRLEADESVVKQLEEMAHLKSNGTTLFLFVGKWEQRKGVKLLLQAYFEEFSHEDKVVLIILTNAYHSTDDFLGEINTFLREEEVGQQIALEKSHLAAFRVLSQVPQRLMPLLYSLASVLVIPSHGEGWGRPHVESMSCGVPVIATNWSGPVEFLTQENGYPLSVLPDLTPTPGWEGHMWSQPSVSHLKELMRRVHTAPEEVKEKGVRARLDTVEKYSIESMSATLASEIHRVEATIKARRKTT